jgi:hypothetical protein
LSTALDSFQKNLPRHHYSCGQITLWISLVIHAATRMRCASRVIKLVSQAFHLPIDAPSWHTGRLWLMRLGYYKIHRSKEIADDWIWIVDHTIQIGPEKCLMILGIRAKDLPENRPLTFNDIEPIELIPVKKSNGALVYEQLENTIKKTGVPREIISDDGPDLKAGINLFLERHHETCRVYDIKHKTASLLKKTFGNDREWQIFLEKLILTKLQLQQTELAFLAPPNQRSKARYMNIDTMITWGCDILRFINNETKNPSKKFNTKKIEEKLNWILDLSEQIHEWKAIISVVEVSESFVRSQGLSSNAESTLKTELNKLNLTEKSNEIKNNLLNFVQNESSKAKEHEKLLGSSEIIESLFGKQKILEQSQSRSGFTGLILSIGAFASQTTDAIIEKAMDAVKTNTVIKWVDEKIGKSVQSFRQKFLIHAEEPNLKLSKTKKIDKHYTENIESFDHLIENFDTIILNQPNTMHINLSESNSSKLASLELEKPNENTMQFSRIGFIKKEQKWN